MYLNTIPAYVYEIRNLLTGQFYFGVRKANIRLKRTPEQDFLICYTSSSKTLQAMIKDVGLDQFKCSIIYQDIDIDAAFWYEQDLIKENWGNPLLLNQQFRDKSTSRGIFLLKKRADGVTERILQTKLEKYGTTSPIRPGSIDRMVATRRARDNYKHKPEFVDKMLGTREKNGTMNTNTPESREKSRQTKIERYGVPHPPHKPETIEKLRGPKSPEHVARVLETKRKNGTLNTNTPESIAKRKETLLAKWGTFNTREIARLKSLKNS